ncbi:MAG TPA: helix-turn-helix transcriptional regulator [Pseudonocardiaceae bacterium]|nr:helix-turn-helix transcriptional regulator [Pseudonocardiaceae bacterium]
MPRGRSQPVAHSEIAKLLRKIRDDAGVTSGIEAGRRAGFSQAKVSRMEAGRLVPSPEDADRYARALGASAAVRRQLVAMARDLHEQHRAAAPARVSVSRSAAHEQRVRRNEARARRIAVFHPIVIPGLLQTEEYIRALFASGDLPTATAQARVTERLLRAQILDEPGRQFTFLLTAGALGWRVGSPETMVRQLEHIAEVSHRPQIRVGVIPWGAKATVFPPCGFDLYDEHTVVVGVVGGAAYYNDPADVARYLAMLTALEGLAVFGDEARAELRLIAAKYRRLANLRSQGDRSVRPPGRR